MIVLLAGGYSLAGFSFTPTQLFDLLSARRPDFKWSMSEQAEQQPAEVGSAAMFARLWPDSLSPFEAARDLGFEAQVTLLGCF